MKTLKLAAALAVALSSASAVQGSELLDCTAAEPEQAHFIEMRVSAMPENAVLRSSDAWVAAVEHDMPKSTELLEAFCKDHPALILPIAFQIVFDAD